METAYILNEYIECLAEDTGWRIIISDTYGLLNGLENKGAYGIINGWRNGEYCLKIKSDRNLWRRCVALKTRRNNKFIQNPSPNWYTCYCGVAEYVLPVIFNGVLIAEVAVTGFKGRLSPKMAYILSQRTNTTIEDFNLLHSGLNEITPQQTKAIEIYLSPVKEMLLKIAAEAGEEYFFSLKNSADPAREYVKQALDFISEKYMEQITAADVAKHCNLSLSHLQHLFAKLHFRGVFGEILHRRIEMACYMLKNTKSSVREIALKCGFGNVDYFSVAFKKNCGITPLKYRNQNKR